MLLYRQFVYGGSLELDTLLNVLLIILTDAVSIYVGPSANTTAISLQPSRPLWKDPGVWACLFIAGVVLAIQGSRVGLLQKITKKMRLRNGWSLMSFDSTKFSEQGNDIIVD